MAVTTIADASRDIEELEAAIRRENARRYAFYRMLNATDRVLGHLEELNHDGVQELPRPMQQRMRASLRELPNSCMEVYVVSDRVQEVLDSVFEVQERLLRWRDPLRATELEEDVDA
jgi:hypothetical protein